MSTSIYFRKIEHNRYLLYLSLLFLAWWSVLAIDPNSRADWMLENVMVLVAVLVIAGSYKKFPLSRISYTLIFIFLCLHEIGAHYTYAETPYDIWFLRYTGINLNELFGFQRNHFDRLAHFAYGLLLAYPIREMFIRIVDVRGFWGYFLPLDLTLSTSALFELIEWLAALLVGSDLGAAYLGMQGDVWDAQKDMLAAAIGALLAMVITAIININLQRDFAREWNNSLKVKWKQPLGEYAIMKMWGRRHK